MKPGEYLILFFVGAMIVTFFSIFIWYQVKRYKRLKANGGQMGSGQHPIN